MTTPMEERTMEAVFRIEAVAADISEIKETMRILAAAISKLALLEERQAHDRCDILRTFESIERHDIRIKSLELVQPVQSLTSGWVQSAMWIVVAGVLSSALSLVVVGTNSGKPAPAATERVGK